jgi:sporulation protein YunB
MFAGTLLLAIFVTLAILIHKASPSLAVLAKAEAREYVMRAINDSVKQEVDGGRLRYDEMVSLVRDGDGAVSALVTDMVKLNLIQANISNRIALNVVNLINNNMSIHLGDIANSVFFSGRGPAIPVRVQAVSDVSTRVVNSFTDSGINQTHHKIALEVSVTVEILIPGGNTSAEVVTEVAVAETIIVGKVPNFYANGGG